MAFRAGEVAHLQVSGSVREGILLVITESEGLPDQAVRIGVHDLAGGGAAHQDAWVYPETGGELRFAGRERRLATVAGRWCCRHTLREPISVISAT